MIGVFVLVGVALVAGTYQSYVWIKEALEEGVDNGS